MNPTDISIAWPTEWLRAPERDVRLVFLGETRGGEWAVVDLMLTDGSNLLALTFPGGHRLLRMLPETGFAQEERYIGRPLTAPVDQDLIDTWRFVLDLEAQASAQVRAARS